MNHRKDNHTGAIHAREYMLIDTLHPILAVGLTSASPFIFYLILVDAYSRYICIYGLLDKSTQAVISTMKEYQAGHKLAGAYGHVNLECICTDAGRKFMADGALSVSTHPTS
jgi:hypothetical protein